jgi:CRISPR/Cas system-associated endonuclease/helicase Cas3
MEITTAMKSEIVDLILKRQQEMLNEQNTDYEYVMYLDEIKDIVWQSYTEDISQEEDEEEDMELVTLPEDYDLYNVNEITPDMICLTGVPTALQELQTKGMD